MPFKMLEEERFQMNINYLNIIRVVRVLSLLINLKANKKLTPEISDCLLR